MSDDEGVNGKPVGYRNPPKSGQFKKGAPSPNPKGRPRKAATTQEALAGAMGRKVSLAVDGARKRVSVREALSLKLIQGALAGDPKVALPVMKMAKDWEAEEARDRKAAAKSEEQTPERQEAARQFRWFVYDLFEIGKALHQAGIFVVVEGNRARLAKWLVDLVISQRPDLASALSVRNSRTDYVVDVSSSDPWPKS